MDLPLDTSFKFGVQTIHRGPDLEAAPWVPDAASVRALTGLLDRLGYDSLWVGDHIAFALPILDPLLQLAHAAAFSQRLTFGTGIYLLPLRHPTPVAKQVATLDHLSGGRFIFGVGVGGEFPGEYDACGVPLTERGARLTESIRVLRALWSGEAVANDGRFYPFSEVRMLPTPKQPGGPPIWCGGRSRAALERCGRMADGWISYVVTPDMYRSSLETIAGAAADREVGTFGTSHLLFTCIDDRYETALEKAVETLSTRYAMDFRAPAKKYAALGPTADIAARLAEFHRAGVRHVVLDFLGPMAERDAQIERFASEVRPLIADL